MELAHDAVLEISRHYKTRSCFATVTPAAFRTYFFSSFETDDYLSSCPYDQARSWTSY